MVAHYATAQIDTTNKNIAVKDSLHSSVNIFMANHRLCQMDTIFVFLQIQCRIIKELHYFFLIIVIKNSLRLGSGILQALF